MFYGKKVGWAWFSRGLGGMRSCGGRSVGRMNRPTPIFLYACLDTRLLSLSCTLSQKGNGWPLLVFASMLHFYPVMSHFAKIKKKNAWICCIF